MVIILLHGLTTINFAANWSAIHSVFIENGQSFWTAYLRLNRRAQAAVVIVGITSVMGVIITDIYMVCATWWELFTLAYHYFNSRFGAAGWFGDVAGLLFHFQYFPYLLHLVKCPISSTLSVYSTFCVALKTMKTYYDYRSIPTASESILLTGYVSLVLATTLWCTLFIIYRILTVAGVWHGAGGRWRVYHHCIEVLVESSALYSVSLIVYLAFLIRYNFGLLYLNVISGIARVCSWSQIPLLLIKHLT